MDEKVKAYFGKHSSVKELYATADGFLFEQKQHAKAHAASLEEGQRKVSVFLRGASGAPGQDDVGELLLSISKTDDIQLLEGLYEQEESGEKREQVLKALLERIDQLGDAGN